MFWIWILFHKVPKVIDNNLKLCQETDKFLIIINRPFFVPDFATVHNFFFFRYHTRFDARVADGAPIRGNTSKDEFDIRGGANKKLTYTGKRQFRGFEKSVILPVAM